jgi:GNAT superfamily N-acetyltransferase
MRPATVADLGAINALIERAVMTWSLPDRVKRLAMPTYRYGEVDLGHMDIVVAVAGDESAAVLGVAAWEEASARDCPRGRAGLLLHGIYVDPARHRRGTGSRLLSAAVAAAKAGGVDGLLVRAQAEAVGFFEAAGLRRVPVEDPDRDYAHRFWLDLVEQPAA